MSRITKEREGNSMKKKYSLADFPRRDTVTCLDDGAVENVYVPLLTVPDCPQDLMDRANMIINDLLETCPEQEYDVDGLFIYVQLWVTVLSCGKIIHKVCIGIHDGEDHINLYTHSVIPNTDPIYASFRDYFARHLVSLLFDGKTS